MPAVVSKGPSAFFKNEGREKEKSSAGIKQHLLADLPGFILDLFLSESPLLKKFLVKSLFACF